MSPMTIATRNFNGGKKFMNYSKYIKNSNLYTHVCVFEQAIKVNDVTHEGTKNVYFRWTL
jgi:hypothetical protein